MAIAPGSYALGPDDGTLTIRTGRSGAASKAGHDLRIEVASWQATLEVPDGDSAASLSLAADSRSLQVIEGTGGVKGLSDDDKASIPKTIDKEVLKGAAIAFHSSSVDVRSDGLGVQGELAIGERRAPVAFDLASADGRVTGEATVRQTDFAIKPYSALFGALKVADEVRVGIDARLPAP